MSDTENWQKPQFGVLDYSIFIILIFVSVVIGLIVGIKGWSKATTSDFLVGGRKMHPIPVAMSLIGGVVSALSILGNATEMYLYGTQLTLNLLGCVYGTAVVMFLILPTLYPLKLLSMMQYLEMRFHSVLLKKLGSIDQMLNMILYIGICLYTPSLTLASVTSITPQMSILILGLICTFYISIGGVKAVVYTDVVQMSIMFCGVLAVVILVCVELGGIGNVWEIAEAGGRIQFFNFDPSPFVRHTFWSVQVLGLYFVVSVIGISQPQFQRLNSVRSLKTSQWLCIMFLVGIFALWCLFYLTGLVAYASYHDCDPLASKVISKPDQILPFLIADKLSKFPGMVGLFVAAVYGAVLSSVSSQASAFAALVWDDFLREWSWFNRNICISPTNVTRLLTILAGCIGVLFAFLVGRMGTLFQVAYSISGSLVGPLDGLFVTAIAAPWVNEKGALTGFITAFVFNVWLAIGQFVYGAGKQEWLPLSTENCLDLNATSAVLNGSVIRDASLSMLNLTSVNQVEVEINSEEKSFLSLYKLSYCYFGTLGILIVFTVSSLVSFLTGPVYPDDVDPKLVDSFCLKAYRRIFNLVSKRKSVQISKESSAHKQISADSPSHKQISETTKEFSDVADIPSNNIELKSNIKL